MALVKWEPLFPDTAFDEMLKSFSNFPKVGGVDVYETDDSYVVEAPVAGLDPKDIEVTAENGVITIKGESKSTSEKNKKKKYFKQEVSRSFFYQTNIPGRGVWDNVEAEIENGMIKVTIPKAEDEKPKKIEIKKKG